MVDSVELVIMLECCVVLCCVLVCYGLVATVRVYSWDTRQVPAIQYSNRLPLKRNKRTVVKVVYRPRIECENDNNTVSTLSLYLACAPKKHIIVSRIILTV